MKKFNVRIDNMELMSCDESLTSDGEHTTAVIVSWCMSEERPSCYTLAYWVKYGEGLELKFIGDHPFREDRNTFWALAKYGQQLLENDLQGETS